MLHTFHCHHWNLAATYWIKPSWNQDENQVETDEENALTLLYLHDSFQNARVPYQTHSKWDMKKVSIQKG